MITQYDIAYGAWTAITSAGQDGSAWLDEDNDGLAGATDVRIVNSSSGAPALSEATKGKRVYKPSGNTDILFFTADDSNDIYYATCANSGATAKLSVDAI